MDLRKKKEQSAAANNSPTGKLADFRYRSCEVHLRKAKLEFEYRGIGVYSVFGPQKLFAIASKIVYPIGISHLNGMLVRGLSSWAQSRIFRNQSLPAWT